MWKSHKKPNVVFLNMSNRRARALEQKRKEAELATQKSGKKQNVPFLLGSMFKKRQKPPNETRTKGREVQTFQLALEPSPPKIMKFETDSIFKTFGFLCDFHIELSEQGGALTILSSCFTPISFLLGHVTFLHFCAIGAGRLK
jgi:hypothetical protein